MIICHCRAITDRDVHDAAARGATCVRDILCDTRKRSCCGSCCETIRSILSDSVSTTADSGSSNP